MSATLQQPAFKFDSQSFFLTYAQCDLEIQTLYDWLASLQTLVWCRIAKEKHADGQPHLHAVGRYQKRVQTRNARHFDIQGFHPNIQGVRSVLKSLAYVAKDGEFTDFGPVPKSAADTNWCELAATNKRTDYFRAALQERLPYQYAKEFWDSGNRTCCDITAEYEPDLTRESCQLLLESPRVGSTVVVGASGMGKTSWAKRVCAKPALWVCHLDMLRSFRPDYHKSIIFDDMSFKHMPRETQIYLVDYHEERHIHIRYGVAVIPKGTEKIFTANYWPFATDRDDPHQQRGDPAILRRVKLIQVEF